MTFKKGYLRGHDVAVRQVYNYRQSLEEYGEVHRHPAQSEADSDVDHGSHDVDLCLRQTLSSDLTTITRRLPGRYSSSCLAVSCTCSSDWFRRCIGVLLTFCTDLCPTTYDRQDLPVCDDKDDQRYYELPQEHEYPEHEYPVALSFTELCVSRVVSYSFTRTINWPYETSNNYITTWLIGQGIIIKSNQIKWFISDNKGP